MDFDTFVNSVVLEGMSLASSLIPLQDAINDHRVSRRDSGVRRGASARMQ